MMLTLLPLSNDFLVLTQFVIFLLRICITGYVSAFSSNNYLFNRGVDRGAPWWSRTEWNDQGCCSCLLSSNCGWKDFCCLYSIIKLQLCSWLKSHIIYFILVINTVAYVQHGSNKQIIFSIKQTKSSIGFRVSSLFCAISFFDCFMEKQLLCSYYKGKPSETYIVHFNFIPKKIF